MTEPIPSRTESVNPLPEHFGRGHPSRDKLAGVAWRVLGLVLHLSVPVTFVLWFFLWIGWRAFVKLPDAVMYGYLGGALLAGFFLTYLASKCYVHAKRLLAPSALEVLASERRPVVYFRPFTDDVDTNKTTFARWWSQEEALARAMDNIGPLVAIGAPEETLPSAGAARMYVADEKWQNVVLDLLERAIVVVMRIGTSPGFWWELETVRQRVKPEKLVLLIPNDQALYEQFRLASRNLIPTKLPTITDWAVRRWAHQRPQLNAVIFFNSEWAPSIVLLNWPNFAGKVLLHCSKFPRLWRALGGRDCDADKLRSMPLRIRKPPFLRRSLTMPLVSVLQMALRPVYENIGLRWTGPPIDRWKLFSIGYFVVGFVTMIVGLIVIRVTGGL